jgi:hypothetical protein
MVRQQSEGHTLYVGVSLIAFATAALSFVNASVADSVGCSPTSSQIVSRRGIVWYTYFEPYLMAFAKNFTVYKFIFSPLLATGETSIMEKHGHKPSGLFDLR